MMPIIISLQEVLQFVSGGCTDCFTVYYCLNLACPEMERASLDHTLIHTRAGSLDLTEYYLLVGPLPAAATGW
jgi:hypothetical protein